MSDGLTVTFDVSLARMVNCLLREWEVLSQHYNIQSPVTIFFGGGTPSLLDVRNVELLIKTISASGEASEVSLEANPGDVLDKIERLRDAGVNRLSLGVQSLNESDLRALNRNHDPDQAIQALRESLRVFPSQTSADLIFGRPGQTVSAWREELERLLDLSLPHVSLYQLTLERGTALHRSVTRGEVSLPTEDEMADMYHLAVETLSSRGLGRYEVSNFSVSGSECLHNAGYWSGRQYLGLGPGAHSRVCLGGERRSLVNIPEPGRWMAEVERGGHGVRLEREMEARDALKELLATGLRTRAGVSVRDWNRLSQGQLQLETLFDLVNKQNLGLQMSDGRLRLSDDKISVLDNILPYVFNCLDEI